LVILTFHAPLLSNRLQRLSTEAGEAQGSPHGTLPFLYHFFTGFHFQAGLAVAGEFDGAEVLDIEPKLPAPKDESGFGDAEFGGDFVYLNHACRTVAG
jgi:hypothetical protein